MFTCTKCGVTKPVDQFGVKNTKLGHRKECKICYATLMRKYYKDNPDKYEKQKRYVVKNDRMYKRMWWRHHISKEKYDLMYEKYDGKCWICKISPIYAIDHDHKCCPGKYSCGDCVRGLLCNRCNLGLGWIENSGTKVYEIVEYLSK